MRRFSAMEHQPSVPGQCERYVANPMKPVHSLLLSVVATIVFVEGVSAQSLTDLGKLPVGNSTPEGAACDLVRAFISRDESLFHAVRPISSCEGKSDPAIAFRRFLAHTPQPIDAPKHGQSGSLHPIRIARIAPVTNPKIKNVERMARSATDWDEVRWDDVSVPTDLNPLFWFGAIESKSFDVITILPNGISATSRVEAYHIGAVPDSGGGLLELLPTNKWCAHFLPASDLEPRQSEPHNKAVNRSTHSPGN